MNIKQRKMIAAAAAEIDVVFERIWNESFDEMAKSRRDYDKYDNAATELYGAALDLMQARDSLRAVAKPAAVS